jgi:hypothetical protein
VAATDVLAGLLARQQMLLMLDNCEHLAGAAAEMCAALLPVADDIRILTTSREPLGVAGEARYRLPPLTLPAPDDPDGISRSEAVAQFADRARRADRQFSLNGDSAPHRPLSPGPDPGQDRLPPPRRPDPAGSAGRSGLAARPGSPGSRAERGIPTPAW